MALFREDVADLIPQLRAFARSLTRGNADLADDLVQDTMLKALQAQAQFTEGTNLRAWLFTILRNRFRTIVTRKSTRSEVGHDDLENLVSTPPVQESRIEVHAFQSAFRRLSPVHREVLYLVGVEGLAYDEIAAICGCEVGTVKSRVSRARNILRTMLLEDELPMKPVRTPLAERIAEIPVRDAVSAPVAARIAARRTAGPPLQ